jgi:hypothetical protein
MRTPEIKEFILQHSNLFWYTPKDKKEDISDELLVETILNYGTLNDYKDLEKLMGIKEISSVFESIKGRKKLNYYPEIYNFFYQYFNKNAQRNT